jgi:hypothetical protein
MDDDWDLETTKPKERTVIDDDDSSGVTIIED